MWRGTQAWGTLVTETEALDAVYAAMLQVIEEHRVSMYPYAPSLESLTKSISGLKKQNLQATDA